MQVGITQLAEWITLDYGLSPIDAAIVLGQGVQLDIAEVVGSHRVVGARVSKKLLAAIPQ